MQENVLNAACSLPDRLFETGVAHVHMNSHKVRF